MMYNSPKVRQALKKINMLSQDRLIEEAIAAYEFLLQELENEHNDLRKEVYLKFAKFLFLNGNDQACISNLRQAKEAGCEIQRISDFISFASGNDVINREKELYESYTANNNCINTPSFDDLKLSFLPSGNGDHIGFDAEHGFFELNPDAKIESDPVSLFSDYLVVESWNMMNIADLIDSACKNNKHCYILCEQPERLLSFVKIEKLRPWFDHITVFKTPGEFEQYMLDTGKYLPWNIAATNFNEIESCRKLLTQIHEKRLLPEFRKGNNILLSICIPSFNRGHRALEGTLHALKTHFDEEIEVIVSNNCSLAAKEGYQKISEIKDSRLRYWCNKSNCFLIGNLVKVISESYGKYVIIMSDEDYLNLENLDTLLNYLINKGQGLAWFRPSYGKDNKFEDRSFSAGKDALSNALFKNNYLTGIVYNKEIIFKSGGLEFIQNNPRQEACSIYPHMVLDIFCAVVGRCEFSSMILAIQGKDESNYTDQMQYNFYQNINKRNEQHQAFFEVIVDIIKKHKLSIDLAIHLLMKLTNKTYCLLIQNTFMDGNYSREKRLTFNKGVEKLHHETKDNLTVISEMFYNNLSASQKNESQQSLRDILKTAFTEHFVKIDPDIPMGPDSSSSDSI